MMWLVTAACVAGIVLVCAYTAGATAAIIAANPAVLIAFDTFSSLRVETCRQQWKYDGSSSIRISDPIGHNNQITWNT